MDLALKGKIAMVTGGSRGWDDGSQMRWREKDAKYASAPGTRNNWRPQ
jgi:hypothetical protein